MIVMKFGGSSVRDAERINCVAEIVRKQLSQKPLLVVSALGTTTNNLLKAGQDALIHGVVAIDEIRSYHLTIAKQAGLKQKEITPLFDDLENLLKGISLLRELSKKTSDYLVSFGERLAVRIVAGYLVNAAIPSKAFDAWDLGMQTTSRFSDAEVMDSTYASINSSLKSLEQNYDFTPVITGFIGKDLDGQITTLGRGGSDLTASVFGAAVGATEIQVWKDVDGILTTDPRIAPAARPIPAISFEEASELAYFGAKVLHPLAMQPAMSRNITVRVKNSYNPDHPGTAITAEAVHGGLVKAITCKRKVTLIDIVSSRMLGQYGFLAGVFQIFANHHLSVDMVATSEVSVSLTLNQNAELGGIVDELKKIARVTISSDKAILSIIGDVRRSSEILDTTFRTLQENMVNVQMISQGASKVNIGLIVEDLEVELCVRELHRRFFETERLAA